MLNIKTLISIITTILLFTSISLADTFVVRNLNDPGAGSLRRAITNSNLNPGPDTIEFRKGLQGTIFLNTGNLAIQDDLTINGPGGGGITIDARGISNIFDIFDDDNDKNNVVIISGLRLINGIAVGGALIDNNENLTVESCQFLNGNASIPFFTGGAINNRKFLTVDSCLFENNSARFGGAIFNDTTGTILGITNSVFRNNQAGVGGAIQNQANVELISNSTFSNNSADSSGAINNFGGTIKEIRNSTFNNNYAVDVGGAIFNQSFDLELATIQSIVNSTFYNNASLSGSAIRNDGVINISFTTIANNPSPTPFPSPPPVQSTDLKDIEMERGGIVTVGLGITRVRNSIISSNSPDNCFGFLDDFGGNYSNDFSCGLFGDGAEIILNPLADNGGPTETMALRGVNPIDGATVNCDALDENGNPTGIPVGVDQRYFPRPYGTRCDSGAVEVQPGSIVLITKISSPSLVKGFEFVSSGFSSLVGCGITGDNGTFTLDDKDSIQCIVPTGEYRIREEVPDDYRLSIECFGENPNLIIDNENDEIIFSVPEIEPSPDVICFFFNIKKGSGGGCALAGSTNNNNSFPLYLLIPALILIRRFVWKYTFKSFEESTKKEVYHEKYRKN